MQRKRLGWEKEELRKLYSGKYAGEGWFGRERAENLSLVKTREHLHLIAELTGGI